jgi:hypothetical protein
MSVEIQENLSVELSLLPQGITKLSWEMELRSCPLISCKIGNFYHMEGKARLTLIDTLINGVVMILINNK